jgi:TIR domain
MKIFISWSGNRSQIVAKALREFLPEIFQDVEPWMSDRDIQTGSRWGQDVSSQLDKNSVGIICLTPENLGAPWILFEAGALAKSVDNAKVIPYRLKLQATDVQFPLAQFQGVDANESGTRKLLQGLNTFREPHMPEERLERIFQRWWPDWNERIANIPKPSGVTKPDRSDRSLLEEVLEHVRSRAKVTDDPDLISRGIVWKTIHAVSDFEMQQMDPPTLQKYLSALEDRWKIVTGDEEARLHFNIQRAYQLLAARRPSTIEQKTDRTLINP